MHVYDSFKSYKNKALNGCSIVWSFFNMIDKYFSEPPEFHLLSIVFGFLMHFCSHNSHDFEFMHRVVSQHFFMREQFKKPQQLHAEYKHYSNDLY